MKSIIVLSCLCALFSGCATNAITGRSQLRIVSNEQVMQLAEQSYAQLVTGSRNGRTIDDQPQRIARITKITDSLVIQAKVIRPDTSNWPWQITIIKSPIVNAGCMPGGRMIIYTGLIERLNLTDDEIAVVMGHEISHALLEHIAEKASNAVLTESIVRGIAASQSRNAESVAILADLGSKLFLKLPNSRISELESDKLGMRIAAQAGYDPAAAITLFEKMSTAERQGAIEFFSTHPLHVSRIAQARDALPSMASYRQEQKTKSDVPVIVDNGKVSMVTASNARYELPVTSSPIAAVKPNTKYQINAERTAKGLGCSDQPIGILSETGAGQETYSFQCTGGEVIKVRCEFGQCKSLS